MRKRGIADSASSGVGYRNPPRKHQFKKGQSGNPSGRPRRPKLFPEVVARELSRLVTITEGGTKHRITKREAAAKRLVNGMVMGDIASWKAVMSLLAKHDQHEDPEAAARSEEISKRFAAILNQMASLKARGLWDDNYETTGPKP